MVAKVDTVNSSNNWFFQPNVGLQVGLRALPGLDLVVNGIQQHHFAREAVSNANSPQEKTSNLKKLIFTQKIHVASNLIKAVGVVALMILFPPAAIPLSLLLGFYAGSNIRNILDMSHNLALVNKQETSRFFQSYGSFLFPQTVRFSFI